MKCSNTAMADLDETTVGLRAAVMDAENVRCAAEPGFDLYAVYGISVEGVIGETASDTFRNERIANYRRVRSSWSERWLEATWQRLLQS